MHKFNNNEFMAVLRLNATNMGDKSPYLHCTRWELAPQSSVYVHKREGHTFYTATGTEAAKFCLELLGKSTKNDSHGYKMWYIYDITREVA